MARNCKTLYDAAIVGGHIWFEDVRQCGLHEEAAVDLLEDSHLKAIRLVSLSTDWRLQTWVDFDVNIIENINFEMTLRKEKRGQQYHWYAYRRAHGKLHKRYVGGSDKITEERLLKVAQTLPSV